MTEPEWMASEDPAAMLQVLGVPQRHVSESQKASDRKLRLWVEACRAHSDASDYVDDLGSCSGLRVALEYWGSRDGTSVSQAVRAHLLRDIIGTPHRPVTLPPGPACGRCKGEGGFCVTMADGYGGDYKTEWATCRACQGRKLQPCLWLTPTVVSLAHAAYDSRDQGRPHKKCRCGRNFARLQKKGLSPPLAWCNHCAEDGGWWADAVARESDGTLDPVRLAVLADALEEAGCDSEPCGPLCAVEHSGTRHTPDPCPRCGNSGRVPHPLLAHLRDPGPHVRGCWAVDAVLGRE